MLPPPQNISASSEVPGYGGDKAIFPCLERTPIDSSKKPNPRQAARNYLPRQRAPLQRFLLVRDWDDSRP